MTKKIQETPEVLDEGALDQAAGGFRYELKNVMVTSYQTSGSAMSGEAHKKWIDILSVDQGTAKGDAVPTEDFSLNFEEIKVT